MRAIGIDYGERRIGLAVSDELGLTAQPLTVYERRGRRADLAYLAGKVREAGADLIVMGMPWNMNGTRGSSAVAAERFGNELSRAAGREVVFVDERLTTAAATRDLLAMDLSRTRRRQVIDQTAAALILQGYLDRAGRAVASDQKEREE